MKMTSDDGHYVQKLRTAMSEVNFNSSYTSGHQRVKVIYRWTVPHFSLLQHEPGAVLHSPLFSPVGEPRWRISLYPGGQCQDYARKVSVFLQNMDNAELYVKHMLAVVDSGGALKEEYVSFNKFRFSGWGCPTFVDRNELLHNPKLLPDDSLTLYCRLEYLKTTSRPQSGPQSVLQSGPQPTSDTLRQDMAALLTDGTLTDMTIEVEKEDGDTDREELSPHLLKYTADTQDHCHVFTVHRAVMAARSCVFKAMLTNQFKEKQRSVVRITDITPATMGLLLHFMYCGTVGIGDGHRDGHHDGHHDGHRDGHHEGPGAGLLDEDQLCQLLIAANKYQVSDVKSHCEAQLMSVLSVSNACRLLKTADLYSAPALKSAAVNFVLNMRQSVVDTDGWKELVHSSPDLIALLFKAA